MGRVRPPAPATTSSLRPSDSARPPSSEETATADVEAIRSACGASALRLDQAEIAVRAAVQHIDRARARVAKHEKPVAAVLDGAGGGLHRHGPHVVPGGPHD